MADADGDRTIAWRPAPNIWVTYGFDWRSNVGVDGHGFTASSSVELRLYDAPGGALLWTGQLPTDEEGSFGHCCVVPELTPVALAPGMQVVVTDPLTTISRGLTLVDVRLDIVDPVGDTASGKAPPGTELFVTGDDWGEFWATPVAGEDGTWSADLGAIGWDVGWGAWLEVGFQEPDGDVLVVNGSPPTIEVRPATDTIAATEFTLRSAPAVEIRAAGGALLWGGTVPMPGASWFTLGRETHGVDLVPGMVVRVTDVSGIAKELTIVPLSIDVLDPVADVARGTGVPGTTVALFAWWPGEGGGQLAESVPVDATGHWTVDFTAGPDPIDIRDDTVVTVVAGDDELDGVADEITATPGAIANLRAVVEALVASGGLDAKQAAQPEQKLDQAAAKLTDGNLAAARASLGAFANKVEALVRSGRLAPAAGAELVAAAERIAAAL